MVWCSICLKAKNAPYKCPVCRISYCTVKCFKIHKDSKCQPKEITKNIEESPGENYTYVTEDTLSVDKLKQLENSEELQKILTNKHVRDILLDIDTCKNPNEMLERAMKEPIFVEFVDACLKVVEDRQDDSENVS